MKEFRVTLHQRAGELARLARMISQHHLNLKSVSAFSVDNKAIVCLVCEDVAGLRSVLTDARIVFEEHELLTHVMEHSPGHLAALADQLAEKGVNLTSLYIMARAEPLIEVGFTCDDPTGAKKALEE